jgi:flagellar basal body rod protein FlgB
MPIDFVARTTPANQLKASLDVSAQRTRVIADRVARASAQRGGFVLPGTNAEPGSQELGPIDVESEMVSLADEQLRFETTAKLLEKAYAGLRMSLQNK